MPPPPLEIANSIQSFHMNSLDGIDTCRTCLQVWENTSHIILEKVPRFTLNHINSSHRQINSLIHQKVWESHLSSNWSHTTTKITGIPSSIHTWEPIILSATIPRSPSIDDVKFSWYLMVMSSLVPSLSNIVFLKNPSYEVCLPPSNPYLKYDTVNPSPSLSSIKGSISPMLII